MPLLATWKRRVGRSLNSSAAVKEASQTQLCAYLSIALLIGLGANALFGLWWMDPAAALFIAARDQGRSRKLAQRRLLRCLLSATRRDWRYRSYSASGAGLALR